MEIAYPIGYADNINLYSYVGSNPLNYTDPEWLFAANIAWWTASIALWKTIKLALWEEYYWRDYAIDWATWAIWVWVVNKVKYLKAAWKWVQATWVAIWWTSLDIAG